MNGYRCINCEEQILQSPGRGRPRMFCNAACRSEHYRSRMVQVECSKCGSKFIAARGRKHCQSCTKYGRTIRCGWCGQQSAVRSENGASRSKYCSRDCTFSKWRVKRMMRDRQRLFKSMLRHPRSVVCDVCGTEFSGPANQKRCSKQCMADASRNRASLQRRNRGCIECGAAPCVMVRDARSRYCESCRERNRRSIRRKYGRMSKSTRRARMRGVMRERVLHDDVFRRDGYRCGVCGRKCRKDVVHPHPLAATLDHIVPLAKGGSHTMDNVQCAHSMCNSRKSDKAGGQMRLFG